jgi:hypothetical protein
MYVRDRKKGGQGEAGTILYVDVTVICKKWGCGLGLKISVGLDWTDPSPVSVQSDPQGLRTENYCTYNLFIV